MITFLLVAIFAVPNFAFPRISSIDKKEFAEATQQYKDATSQFHDCFSETRSYKENDTFVQMTVTEAAVLKEKIHSCLQTSEVMFAAKDRYLKVIGASPTAKPSLNFGNFLASAFSGDLTPAAGMLNFASELMKPGIALMKVEETQLGEYIASGDIAILQKESKLPEESLSAFDTLKDSLQEEQDRQKEKIVVVVLKESPGLDHQKTEVISPKSKFQHVKIDSSEIEQIKQQLKPLLSQLTSSDTQIIRG